VTLRKPPPPAPARKRTHARSALGLLGALAAGILSTACQHDRIQRDLQPERETTMRPVIGITCSFGESSSSPGRLRMSLNAAYMDAIYAAGGLPYPLPLPPQADPAFIDELLARCDGLLLTGGSDLHPQRYGQAPHPKTEPMHPRRDAFEIEIFRRADTLRKPILAICLGFQVVHVGRGGKLIQHIPDFDRPNAVAHSAAPGVSAYHAVRIAPDSHLARVVGAAEIETNSRHHQAVHVDHQGRDLRAVAFAPDGILEASEDMDGRFLLAVQWHPEDMIDRPEHLRLFQALVEAARKQHK